MNSQGRTQYKESRTGRGDAWFNEISNLESQAANLKKVAAFFQAYAGLVSDGFSSLPPDEHRQIVVADIMAYCHNQEAKALDVADVKQARANEMSRKGVPDVRP